MTYTPTKEELEEFGMESDEEFPSIYMKNYRATFCSLVTYSFVTKYFYIGDCFIYPQSKSDIETLIRLFTNPNE